MYLRSSSLGAFSPEAAGAISSTGGAVATAVAGQVIGAGAASAATGAAATGAVTAGSLIASAAVPVIGALVALGLQFFLGRKSGAQKIAATQIVEEVEPFLKQNRDLYLSAPIRTTTMQAEALKNFDDAWKYVTDNCSNPELADAGRRCISERQAGGQWDWFAYYRNPIANDSSVVSDTQGAVTSIFGEGAFVGGEFRLSALLPLGLAVAAAWAGLSLLGGDKA